MEALVLSKTCFELPKTPQGSVIGNSKQASWFLLYVALCSTAKTETCDMKTYLINAFLILKD
jgi:hypothetical protein